jgi:hypothetical protein
MRDKSRSLDWFLKLTQLRAIRLGQMAATNEQR